VFAEVKFDNILLLIILCLLILFSIPLCFRLTISNDFVTSSFLGFEIVKFKKINIGGFSYGNIGLWGSVGSYKTLNHGNGVAISVNYNGVWKNYGFSEHLYGKKAIEELINFIGISNRIG
jgi:hypothetical protein